MTDRVLTAARLAARRDRVISSFEFMPAGLFYLPVVIQWIVNGLIYGDMSLPTAANPTFDTGGLCGESKAEILALAGPLARGWIAPWVTLVAGMDAPAAVADAAGFGWPVVLKPDVGCNGAGVRLVADAGALLAAVAAFSRGTRLMLQRYVPDAGEAGLFYIRHPNESIGRITSLTLKRQPSVVGDGRSTLDALVRADPRAGRLAKLYLPRLAGRLAEVPATGVIVPLVFTGNHCKGAIFQDGADRITPALTRQIEAIARDIPGFHFGRIDVRFASEAALRLGRGFTIIEVNGAGSEATHIWDANTTYWAAQAAQLKHYGAAWAIGRANRARGARTSGLRTMYQKWRLQLRLMASYPAND